MVWTIKALLAEWNKMFIIVYNHLEVRIFGLSLP